MLSRSKKDRKADEQREMARLWLAGESNVEIAKRLGVTESTIREFSSSGEIANTLGWKVDPGHTDIDPPLYDVWKAKASSCRGTP